MRRFRDREEAGEELGELLLRMSLDDPVVYALPRGGAPVAAAVAETLNAPFDVIIVRKIGAPGFEELAIGAVADGAEPVVVIHDHAVEELGVSDDYIARAKNTALAEIERRRKLYRDRLPVQRAAGRTAILVDDGLATGSTMEAAVLAVRKGRARRIVIAVPVAPRDVAARMRALADDFVCLSFPSPFIAVGACYDDFRQLTDADMSALISRVGKDGLFKTGS